MPKINRQQAEIFYEVYGEKGPWVTLINGHMRTHKDFRALSKKLEAAGFRVLVFDNRGVGESTTELSFSLHDIASDAFALWQELGVQNTHLMGISMGGVISQILAAQYPEVVRSLVLVSSTSHNRWLTPISEQSWGLSPEDIQSKLKHYFAESFVMRNHILVESMSKQMAKELQKSSYQSGAQLQRNAMDQINLEVGLLKIKSPTLILHGQEDKIISAEAADKMHQMIASSELRLIPNVGHLLLAEYAKALFESVIDFFRKH